MEVSILEILTDGMLQDVTVFVLPLPEIVVINFSEKRHDRPFPRTIFTCTQLYFRILIPRPEIIALRELPLYFLSPFYN